jgi:O-acetylserine/cysteine efflux transporter
MSASHIALAVGVTLIWGLNFVVVKVGLGTFPPILFSALRFAVAGCPALLFVNRKGLPWRWILAMGACMGVVVYSLLFIALDLGIPAGLSSLVVQVHVIFTLILSAVVLRDRPSLWQWTGTGIAFVGIAVLILDAQGSSKALALVLVIGSALAWALCSILLKIAGDVDMVRLMIWMSIVPPLPLLAISLLCEQGQWQAVVQMGWSGFGALVYSGLLSTIVAFAIWGRLIRRYSPKAVVPFSLLVPVVAIMASWVFLSEQFDGPKWVASLLILSGLLLVIGDQKIGRFLATPLNPRLNTQAPVIFDYFRIR